VQTKQKSRFNLEKIFFAVFDSDIKETGDKALKSKDLSISEKFKHAVKVIRKRYKIFPSSINSKRAKIRKLFDNITPKTVPTDFGQRPIQKALDIIYSQKKTPEEKLLEKEFSRLKEMTKYDLIGEKAQELAAEYKRSRAWVYPIKKYILTDKFPPPLRTVEILHTYLRKPKDSRRLLIKLNGDSIIEELIGTSPLDSVWPSISGRGVKHKKYGLLKYLPDNKNKKRCKLICTDNNEIQIELFKNVRKSDIKKLWKKEKIESKLKKLSSSYIRYIKGTVLLNKNLEILEMRKNYPSLSYGGLLEDIYGCKQRDSKPPIDKMIKLLSIRSLNDNEARAFANIKQAHNDNRLTDGQLEQLMDIAKRYGYRPSKNSVQTKRLATLRQRIHRTKKLTQ